MKLLNLVVEVLVLLLAVAFYTLFERKILSLSQTRIGPNKTSVRGLFQPLIDGVKLLFKSVSPSFKSSELIFWFAPLVSFIIMLFIWLSPSPPENLKPLMGGLFLIGCIGGLIYSIMLSGWGSMSKYSMVGAVRSCSQSVSYEVLLILLLVLIFTNTLSIGLFKNSHLLYWLFSPIFVLSLVAESNRAPFDFSEGESELISGFNIEFASGGFVLLFLAEYGLMIFFSFITSWIFFGSSIILFSSILMLFILLRTSFPRYRYDKLMEMMWFMMLPLTICSYLIILMV